MKKQFTLFAMLIFSITIFAQETLVEWNFPEEGADSIADGGIAQNLDKPMYTMGGTSNLDYKNGATTKAAQATNWNEGAELKCWVVELNSENYGSLLLSSKLSSGGNEPGPRDFRVDYKIGEQGTWTEVAGSAITTANDWETGVLEDLALPEECSNQPLVYIRWIMTSNISSSGEVVESGGKLKMDDVIVKGTDISSVGELAENQVSVYPNPFRDFVNIKISNLSYSIEIYDNTGRLVHQTIAPKDETLYLNHLNPGLYLVKITDADGTVLSTAKLLKK
jgi:hypothetical protein